MIQIPRTEKWNNARFGLVLAGGGAKGAYQAGVIQALYELDIADKVCAVSGTSVGALNTLAFALGRKELCPGVWENIGFKDVLVRADKEERTRLRQLWRELSAQGIRLRDFDAVLEYISREGKSLFTQQGLKAMLERELDFAALRQSRPALYVCAYDIAQGRPEYFALKALADAEIIQATLASAPSLTFSRPSICAARPMRTAASIPAPTLLPTRITPRFRRCLATIWMPFSWCICSRMRRTALPGAAARKS